MKLYDITVPISVDIPVWPGDPPARLERMKSIINGDSCNVTAITMGAHTGTHIDAPYHFLEHGGNMDAIPLDILNGRCRVIETGAEPIIEKKHIDGAGIKEGERILFKTGNSELWKKINAVFREDFIALGLSAAEYLVERGAVLVGIDYLSIEAFNAEEGNPVHKILLRNNIVILEGLDLSAVPAGDYDLLCLPLKISNAEGSPARAVLREIL